MLTKKGEDIMSKLTKTDNANKTPIYKKWWFYVAIILVIGIFGSASEDTTVADTNEQPVATPAPDTNENTENQVAVQPEETPVSTPTPAPKDTVIKPGTYKIGTDLPAGEYLFIADSMSYIEIASDSTGSFESIIANDTVTGHRYITVKDGEYLKLQGGKAYAVADAPSVVPADGLYKDGMYKVGTDIPAGEYKVVVTSSMGYIEVSSGSRGTFDQIITNDVPTADTYITVSDGQYLTLQGVEIQN